MKKNLLLTLCTLACFTSFGQRNCGFDATHDALISKDPSWAGRLESQRASLQGIADRYKQIRSTTVGAKQTSTMSPIPVIFHFMITNGQLTQIGGLAGVQQRIDSQIAVLNRDFNRENLDSVLIPAGWKSLYAKVGIRFGLAHTDPLGYGTPGYELLIIPDAPGTFFGISSNYSSAKHTGTGGLDAWDVTKYLNVWCMVPDNGTILGVTTYKSITGSGGFPANEEGVVLNIGAVGKRVNSTDFYMSTGFGGDHYDQGRTLTHELGHFFEIWHTFGNTSACPWTGDVDDGLADTPPEGEQKYYAYTYDVPNGTYRDSCHFHGTEQQPIGAATLDFMNYTDDIAMQLFTPDQAAVMYAMVSDTGENHSLTQHGDLLDWSVKTAVTGVNAASSLAVFPNPTNGRVFVTFDGSADQLLDVSVTDMLGNVLLTNGNNDQSSGTSVDLTGFSKGIYFIRCNFASGSVTRKITLQ